MKLLSIKDIEDLKIENIKQLYQDYVSESQVKLLTSFDFGNDIPSYSKGLYIYTTNGKKILDFTGGFGVLNHGHNHERIINARIEFQKKNKVEVHKNYLCPYLAALSHNIAQVLPGDLNISYLPNSGAEANEGAIKLAYKFHDGKRKFLLHSDISFHGKLLGTGSISSSPEVKFKFPGISDTGTFKWNDIDSLEKKILEHEKIKNEPDIFAIIVEPFSASSLLECSKEFLEKLREICNRKKIILIFDEIYTGWGKTGEYFYFMRYPNIVPDILTMSKSFGGGKSSISCFTTTKLIFEKAYGNTQDSTIHSTTYNAFGEESVTALEAVNIAVEEDYPKKAKNIGKLIEVNLLQIKKKYPRLVKETRGKGCLQGIVFNTGPELIKKIISILPIKLTQDERFLSKLVTSSVISNLYSEFNILSSLGQNKEICLWISPSIIVEENQVNYFFEALSKTLESGMLSLITKFIKTKFKNT